uniref:Uncharacterized protein n=1 Tax=Avena sativa TaxID=4498 RepID=A0ACD5Z560_AVESA
MDRGVIHKSSPLVGEMGAGHGWWSVNNLRPPFEQHNPPLLLPSTTTTTASSSSTSHINSFSSLLLSNHYPLPTTSTAPWHDSSSSNQGQQLQDPWSHLFVSTSASGGLANGEERYKKWEGQALIPTAGGEADHGGCAGYSYRATASHGTGSSPGGDEIQLVISSPPPWARGIQHHHNTLQQQQQQASSPRSSSITSTTSLGSSMLEFSNNCSPRESLSRASGAAFKKVRKEKLGDRVTALHQLVSPFGKTDTASVLLEAIGYIRFLHGQIEGLSSPYQLGGGNGTGTGGSVSKQHEATAQQGERNIIFPEEPGQLLHGKVTRKRGRPDQDGSSGAEEEAKKDLRSRGLCLVPVSCTLDLGADAGPADYWTAAPPFGMGFGR